MGQGVKISGNLEAQETEVVHDEGRKGAGFWPTVHWSSPRTTLGSGLNKSRWQHQPF